MVTRTFLNKSNTIIKGSKENFGLNPICMLHYGDMLSRFIINFDIEGLKETMKSISDKENIKHILKMYNCGSVNDILGESVNGFNGSGERNRAVSFDIIAFKIPQIWDEGVGFDSSLDFWFTGDASIDKNASTWYKATNSNSWDEEGIYTLDALEKEYDKFLKGEESIIITKQHFDHGNENLSLDITEYVNNVINGNIEHNGIGIAFSPVLENVFSDKVNYIGFFNNHTNTTFHPCIETRWNNTIIDNRYNFTINKNNKLYLYAQIGGNLENLDTIPTCTINGKEYEVKQSKKGVYYVDVMGDSSVFEKDVIYYDLWSNIIYNGVVFDDVEMEFVAHSSNSFFKIGKSIDNSSKVNVMVQGINDAASLVRDEEREIKVYFKREYTRNDYLLLEDASYRVYMLNANKEVDVIEWDTINCMGEYNAFTLKTNELVPSTYYIDIKAIDNNNVRIFKQCLRFSIVDNITTERR